MQKNDVAVTTVEVANVPHVQVYEEAQDLVGEDQQVATKDGMQYVVKPLTEADKIAMKKRAREAARKRRNRKIYWKARHITWKQRAFIRNWFTTPIIVMLTEPGASKNK